MENLSKASEEMLAYISPRVIVGWLRHCNYGTVTIPQTCPLKTLVKSGYGYTGTADIEDVEYQFQYVPEEHVAAVLSIATGTVTKSVSTRDIDLAKLAKTIDLLIKAQKGTPPNQYEHTEVASNIQPDQPIQPVLTQPAKNQTKAALSKLKIPKPLNKMALIYNNPQKPMTVYRVQNEKGEGPYTAKDQMDLYLPGGGRMAPSPGEDFLSSEPHPRYNKEMRFGFEKPEHANNWFGNQLLDMMNARGFKLTPVKAQKVFRSKSGKQVMFIPHESETKLQMAKSDWSMEKAISDLPVGKKLPKAQFNSNNNSVAIGFNQFTWAPVGSWDYSKVLTPEQKKAGYSLRVDKGENTYSAHLDERHVLVSTCLHNGKPVGNVFGRIWKEQYKKMIEPHSSLLPAHQGKGLGVKMYEALYSHARNVEGLTRAGGGLHTEAAHRVHLSLAKRHGIVYKPKISEDDKYKYDDYVYSLKAEISGIEPQLDESNLDTVHFFGDIEPNTQKPIRLTRSESQKPCGICGQRMFNGDRFVGCTCFKPLAKNTKTVVTGDTLMLQFDEEWDQDAVLTLLGVFKNGQ